MGLLSLREPTTFYCIRCDKWVEGIEDEENSPKNVGIKQVLCSECGGAILYRVPTFWKKLRWKASQFFGTAFGFWKK